MVPWIGWTDSRYDQMDLDGGGLNPCREDRQELLRGQGCNLIGGNGQNLIGEDRPSRRDLAISGAADTLMGRSAGRSYAAARAALGPHRTFHRRWGRRRLRGSRWTGAEKLGEAGLGQEEQCGKQNAQRHAAQPGYSGRRANSGRIASAPYHFDVLSPYKRLGQVEDCTSVEPTSLLGVGSPRP